MQVSWDAGSIIVCEGYSRRRIEARLRQAPADCDVFFFQAEDGIRDWSVTGVQTCALPISPKPRSLRCRVRTSRWSELISGIRRGTSASMRNEDALLITGYPARAKLSSANRATSDGKLESTTSQSSGGCGGRTTIAFTKASKSPNTRHGQAS